MTEPTVLTGTVVCQQANFYYVRVGSVEYACHMRGRLKKTGETPVVGDRVTFTLEPPTPGEKLPPPRTGSLALPDKADAAAPALMKGAIDRVEPRKSLLKRPTIANVDQVLLVFAVEQPPLSELLLDKFLVLCDQTGFEPVIVFNKRELAPPGRVEALRDLYSGLGYRVAATSATPEGVGELLPHLAGRLSVLAGPSGVGKSSLVNALQPGLRLRAAEVSEKLRRGRHTTRHAQLFAIDRVPGALLADTPGFSFVEFDPQPSRDLAWAFPEMAPFAADCKFPSCLHREEPQCAVRERASLAPTRYASYLAFLDELLALEKRQRAVSAKTDTGVKRRGGRTGAELEIVKLDAAKRAETRRAFKSRFDWEAERDGEKVESDG